MNYFIIDNGCLFVKNHYFFWKNKRINFKDIEEVDIEMPDKRSAGLRVLSKSLDSRLYGAGDRQKYGPVANWLKKMSGL